MPALLVLLLLAGCGTALPRAEAGPGETGLTARIGGGAAAYYSHTR